MVATPLCRACVVQQLLPATTLPPTPCPAAARQAHGGEPIIPFSGAYEAKIFDMSEEEKEAYNQANGGWLGSCSALQGAAGQLQCPAGSCS
jgi:hypothetical protein